MNVPELLDHLEFLLKGYSLERRATTQPFLLQVVRQSDNDYVYNPEDALIPEALIEHVGSLPVVATAIFPYIDDPEVSLGDALTMLAIHDIGEVVTGDENTFTKSDASEEEGQREALKILDPYYHDIYHDVENQNSKTAMFAKSIDKITPDIFDYLTPA